MSGHYQVCPSLTDTERDDLERSIREYGVLAPIVVDERHVVIDGARRDLNGRETVTNVSALGAAPDRVRLEHIRFCGSSSFWVSG